MVNIDENSSRKVNLSVRAFGISDLKGNIDVSPGGAAMKWKDSYNSGKMKAELEEDYFDEEHYSSLKKNKMGLSKFLKISEKPYVLTGMGILVLVMFIVVLFARGQQSTNQKQITALEESLNLLQDRLVRLENSGERIGNLELHQKKLEQFAGRLNHVEKSISLRMDRLAKQLDNLQKKITQTKPKASATQKTASPPKPRTGPRVHQVRRGETLYSIGRQYGVTIETLRRLNKLARGVTIYPGQKILLGPSKSR